MDGNTYISSGSETDPVLSKLFDAEQLIVHGHYAQAMGLYREMLRDNPDNKKILQRKAELASLIRLLGTGNEIIVNRLNRLLEAIRINFAMKTGNGLWAIGDGKKEEFY